jgi:hypothetical protein
MMASVRRRCTAIGVGAVAALGVLAPSLPAATRVREFPDLYLAGALTLAWHGDPSRGCAAAGVCGVTGSLEIVPEAGSTAPAAATLELIDPFAAARAIDVSANGAIGAACADLVPVDLYLAVRRTSAGGLRAVTDPGFSSGQLPSAGRCAGPTVSDLLTLALPARKLGRHGYDLSGRSTLGAGPFAVTVISSLRAISHGRAISITSSGSTGVIRVGGPPRPGHRRVLEEHAEVVYRVAGVSGALTTTFSGVPAPLCDPLGACGSTGTLSESLAARGTVTFSGSRSVTRRVGTLAALADLGAGRLAVNVNATALRRTLSETLAWPSGTTCTDANTQMASLIDFPGPSEGLTLVPGNPRTGPGVVDPLRTRCPGPSGTDVLGIAQLATPLATGAVPTTAIGAHTMTVPLASHATFLSDDYAGARAGSLVLSLVAVRASGGTSSVPAYTPRRTSP